MARRRKQYEDHKTGKRPAPGIKASWTWNQIAYMKKNPPKPARTIAPESEEGQAIAARHNPNVRKTK